jgi:hypothetical protein
VNPLLEAAQDDLDAAVRTLIQLAADDGKEDESFALYTKYRDAVVAAAIASATEREAAVEELVKTAGWAMRLIGMANPGAFENGVTDPTGTIDEGETRAADIYRELSAALDALAALSQEVSHES